MTTGGGTATITAEGSNDNINFTPTPLVDLAAETTAATAANGISANTQRWFHGPIHTRYLRLRISTAVAVGVLQASARLSMVPFSPTTLQVASNFQAQLLVSVGGINGNTASTSANGVLNVGTTYMGTALVVPGGVAGSLAVGGNVADGIAPTLNSQRVSGTDPQGLLRTIGTDRLGAVAIQQEPATAAAPSPAETQLLILAQLKVITVYLRELSSALNAGVAIQDDEAAILQDPTLFN